MAHYQKKSHVLSKLSISCIVRRIYRVNSNCYVCVLRSKMLFQINNCDSFLFCLYQKLKIHSNNYSSLTITQKMMTTQNPKHILLILIIFSADVSISCRLLESGENCPMCSNPVKVDYLQMVKDPKSFLFASDVEPSTIE